MIKYIVYTDGACRGNPGVGGWGWHSMDDTGTPFEQFGGKHDTTNNQMELTAVIMALRGCEEEAEITLYSDSQYVVKGINEWRKGWEAKQFKKVKNLELWKELFRLVDEHHHLTVKWIKGHNNDQGNDKADELANQGIDYLITHHSASSRKP